MDYTSNIFVNESNYQGNTDRAAISTYLKNSFTNNIASKLGLNDADKKKDKPLLALIINQLLNKTSSANGDTNPSAVNSKTVGAKATEEAVSPQTDDDQDEEKPTKGQSSLKLKSQKNSVGDAQAKFAKQNDQSEENDFIDYEDDFGDEFGEQNDEGIKVSSSDIEPVSFFSFSSF